MSIKTIMTGLAALWLACGTTLPARGETTEYGAKSGSKIRLEGTSNIHDWQVESSLIGGSLQVGPEFPSEPDQAVKPGKVQAAGTAFVAVRSLKSVEKDGKPYSDKMDEVMYEHLKATGDPKARISYRLTELVLKEAPASKGLPFLCDSKGELAVAGVTNTISMPVNILPLGQGRIKISGNVAVKMTSFKVEPPAPKLALGLIQTGDDLKIFFEWMLAKKKSSSEK